MAPAKQDTEDDSCVTLVSGGTTIGSWHVTPTYQPYKKWRQLPSSPATGIPSASTEERPREPQDEGFVPESTSWCDLCCPRRGSSAKSLRGTRDGLIWEEVLQRERECVCVCVFLLWFCYCGSIMWAISLHLNTALFMGSMPVLFHLYCVLVASYALFFFSALVTDQPNSCWIRDPAFDIRAQALSEMSQLLLSL